MSISEFLITLGAGLVLAGAAPASAVDSNDVGSGKPASANLAVSEGVESPAWTDVIIRHKKIQQDIKEMAEKEKYKEHDEKKIRTLLFGGLAGSVDIGYTNEAGSTFANETPERLDNNEETWGVEVGYVGKKIVRDTLLLFMNKAEYEGEDSKTFRNWVGDRIKLDSGVRYGRAVKTDSANERELTKKTTYKVKLSYSVPLELIFDIPEYK